jgi:hypothetical protein
VVSRRLAILFVVEAFDVVVGISTSIAILAGAKRSKMELEPPSRRRHRASETPQVGTAVPVKSKVRRLSNCSTDFQLSVGADSSMNGGGLVSHPSSKHQSETQNGTGGAGAVGKNTAQSELQRNQRPDVVLNNGKHSQKSVGIATEKVCIKIFV